MISVTSPLISVVIVCWNSGNHLPRCLESLSRQTFQDFETIIVDNGSQDDSVDHLEERYPNIKMRVERLAKNLGFTAGNNIGARLAQGQWLVLLNADAFPEPAWLAELLKASEENPAFTSFSSRQLQAGHPEILDGAGDVYHVSGMAWRIDLGYPSESYGLEPAEIFSPCGAAAMYLREAFLALGGFDEDFFSYFEDVDLGFRLQLCGHRCLYVPQAVVHHVGSASFGQRSDFAFYHSHRNLIWTYVKNMPSKMFWLHMPEHILANLIYLFFYALRGRGKVLFKAKYDALKGLSIARKKRNTIQRERKVSNVALGRVMEHGLLKPYLLGYYLRKTLNQHN
jgi:GT2 family glycosyltransferase